MTVIEVEVIKYISLVVVMTLLVSLAVLLALAAANPDSCGEWIESLIRPNKCCDYPMTFGDDSAEPKCRYECSLLSLSEDDCCFKECIYRANGIFNGTFHKSELRKRYRNDRGGSDSSTLTLDEKWDAVIDQSLDKCDAEHAPSEGNSSCNIPDYIDELILCSYKHNFLNCPSFVSDNQQCDEAKSFIESCGSKLELVYRFFYWNYMNATNV